jgi:hypothetical protein
MTRKESREEEAMTIRVAAIEVSHWHALHDAAYLRHLIAMPDVELVAIQDSDAGLVARRLPSPRAIERNALTVTLEQHCEAWPASTAMPASARRP